MALVVLLRGVNVGGHRTFRPTDLARQLQHLDVVNIGAAGTFVVRKPVTQAALRAEFSSRLPFKAEIVICRGREIVKLTAADHFADQTKGHDIVRFVSVLAGRHRCEPEIPIRFPETGTWQLKILARHNRFVIGMYRRNMKAISKLSSMDKLFGVAATTRNWNTMETIAGVLT